jgi:N-acetylglutamate synthase-like GNAT family acetyltransferase
MAAADIDSRKPPAAGEYTLRRAERRDALAIRWLVYRAGINPLSLDWRRFWVASAPRARVVACGQIKSHRDGSRELASIAVSPEHRGRGLARAVIEQLLVLEDGPLYLTCRPHLRGLYEKFGFEILADPEEMPAYFRAVWKLARRVGRILPRFGGLLVMRRG